MKAILITSLCVLALGCATVQEEKVSVQGHNFSTGKPAESVVEAIVATLQEENLSVTTINEKFGIVSTGVQKVPAVTVSKWRGESMSWLGTAVWQVDINFNVTKKGDVKMKYCLQGADLWSGVDSCIPYNADVSAKYFERKIKSKL